MLGGAALLLATAAVAAGGGGEPLQGLDPIDALFFAGPGRLLAGEEVVVAGGGALQGWPVTGGRPRPLAALPEADERAPGRYRVEAVTDGRVALARVQGEEFSVGPVAGDGHLVRVGPLRGPFADPAGCGERSTGPVGLAGDLVAYAAEPARTPACAAGERPAVDRPAVVVRDLAAGGTLRAVVPLPFAGAAEQILLAPGHLGLVLATRPDDPPSASGISSVITVRELDTGAETYRSARLADPVADLGEDGTLVFADRSADRRLHPACVGRLKRPVVVPPRGGPRVLPYAPVCGVLRLRAGRLLYTRPRADGYGDLMAGDAAGSPPATLARLTGFLIDADSRRALVRRLECRRDTARTIDLASPGPVVAPAPRRCPVRVTVPRRVRGTRGAPLKIRVRCPLGCHGEIDVQTKGIGSDETTGGSRSFSLRAGRARTYAFQVTFGAGPRRRPAISRVTITTSNPAAPFVRVRRRVRVLAVPRPASLRRDAR